MAASEYRSSAYQALTDRERAERAARSGGEPILEFGDSLTPFVSYVRSDVLLSLQNFRTKSPSEPAFLIATQVMELMFKLGHIEVLQVRDLLDADEIDAALWALRRVRSVQSLLTDVWELLSPLSPADYGEFRDQLGDGSGFQSFAYRQWEFALGNKNAAMARPHAGDRATHGELLRVLSEPSLYDAVIRLLGRNGLPIPADCADRDWAQPYRARPEVEQAWRQVYQERDRYQVLHRLAETLVDVAYEFGKWRATHLLVVERVLGSKPGTGGTSGVDWLRRAAEHRFFPELWSVRGVL
ncbi:tryptophan 2,3-dioxygenase family protein [Streptosporangium sp. NPDC051023]|uniref:tryptophan 2,3-dioxygenase n=1 Tax=Streptosporangium sp. NPDC051023 TaxID=3155410 RepID=UPI00344FFA39